MRVSLALVVTGALLCLSLASVMVDATATSTRTRHRVRVRARDRARLGVGEVIDATEGELVGVDDDGNTTPSSASPASSTPASTPSATSAPAPAPAPAATPAAGTTPPPPPPPQPPASGSASASGQQTTAQIAAQVSKQMAKQMEEMQKRAEEKAKREAKQKEAAAKRAEAKAKREAEKKKRAAERKQKSAEAKKKREAERKKREEEKKKREAEKKAAEAKLKAEKEKNNAEKEKAKYSHPHAEHHKGEAAAKISYSDADSGTWKEVAHNPWPPHNLGIRKFVLTGVGATNIALKRAEGGFGLPHPSPLRVTFDIGWDTDLHKMVEQYKQKAHIDGTLYYANRKGQAVAKLTFSDAVIAAIKWPKLSSRGKRAGKPARMTLVLQPASSKVERIAKVSAAPDAPASDDDRIHPVTRKDFKVEIEGINTDKVISVKLPSIVVRLKRRTRYAYDPERKKQMPHSRLKVTGFKHKHLIVTVPLSEVKQWQDWKHEAPARPRSGSCEILQAPAAPTESEPDAAPAPPPPPTPPASADAKSGSAAPAAAGGSPVAASTPATPNAAPASNLAPLYNTKFHGLFVNRITEQKDRAVIELAYDSFLIEHVSPDDE